MKVCRWLVVACLVGCGDDGGGGETGFAFDAGDDPDRNAVKAGALCDRIAHIQCAGEEHCCKEPGRDFTVCKAEMLDACKKDLKLDAISADPAVGFDDDGAEAVFEEFEALASDCDPGIAAWGASRDGLVGLFRGTVDAGDSCTPERGLEATVAQAGAALASCKDSDRTACMPGLATWTCTERAGKGDFCFVDTNCADGLYCDNPGMDLEGECRARMRDGAKCKAGNECDSLFCKDDTCVAADVQVAFCLAE